jgi:hypothetical protein
MLAEANKHETWLHFVDSQRWECGGLDQASYFAFLRAASLGISPNEALQTIAARIKAAGDLPRFSKLNQTATPGICICRRMSASGRPARPFAQRTSANISPGLCARFCGTSIKRG